MASIINATTSSGVAVSGDTSGVLQLATNGGTTAVTIDTSQNVGIGTSSPSAPLDIQSNSGGTGIRVRGRASANAGAIRYFANDNTTQRARIESNDTSFEINSIASLPITFNTTDTERMRITSTGNVLPGADSTYSLGASGSRWLTINAATFSEGGAANNFITTSSTTTLFNSGSTWQQAAFYTAGTERMRIDSSGNLLVGATTAINSTSTFVKNAANNNAFVISNSATSSPLFGLQIRYSGVDPNSTGSSYLECYNVVSNVYRAEIRSNGGLANYSANNVNFSDAREKNNIELAGSYLDKICSIPVKTFNYIDQNLKDDGGLNLGVIAQDVQAVAPELVSESDWSAEKDGSKMRLSIYQTDLQYALMKCIQEQQALITTLQTQVAELKQKVGA